MRKETISHLVLPDMQLKPGVPTEHLAWIGQYISDKRPDVIVNLGDMADMPSLSSYDRGKRSAALLTYAEDVQSVHRGMKKLMEPFKNIRGYKPRLVFTLGNHEDRINRAIEDDSRLYGTISVKDLQYEEAGWEVYPFLQPVVVDGISYAHYFTSGVMGRPVTSARALVKAKHCSAVMGHVQRTDVFLGDTTAEGKHITGLFAGTCYLHDEPYLNPQGNVHRRHIVMLNDVREGGEFDLCFVSLEFLRRKYGKRKAA